MSIRTMKNEYPLLCIHFNNFWKICFLKSEMELNVKNIDKIEKSCITFCE